MSRTIRIHRWECCFNTSHVVVYLVVVRSAFCLSWFQYISCCSLSLLALFAQQQILCFNTSHVVVYRAGGAVPADRLGGFNTSHVVVYRNWNDWE